MDSCTIVLFGATGDLTRRKLIPSLYYLLLQKKVSKIAVIGAALDDTTVSAIMAAAESFCPDRDPAIWQKLTDSFYYQQLNFERKQDYERLAALITQVEQKHDLSGNRIIYCATAASFFCAITEQVAQVGIASRKGVQDRPWHRLVYEKPFGHDLESAHTINECIESYFDEQQIYRIDHFLTKELVNNISLIRFANAMFEPLWDHRYIAEVQIILSESIGVEGRGAYYDAFGALRDVVQNHMLELLALVGMEEPKKLSGQAMRDERTKVLNEVRFVDGFLAQYSGYQNESNVAPDSKTESFAVLKLAIDNARWAGVPFYLKTGKCLEKKETVIHIKFKEIKCILLTHCPVPSNWLTIEVAPQAAFSLQLNVKKPTSSQLMPVNMEFCHSCIFGPQTPEAYEVLFEEVMRGEQSISVRFDEIESAWRIIDHIKKQPLPLYRYEPKTSGPEKEIEAFGEQHGMKFKS